MNSTMSRITLEEVTDRPWEYSPEQWKYVHGIHSPHIAEISPMQYAHLSKAGKRRYDAKRDAEWSASGKGWADWKDAVLAAYEAGTIDRNTPGIHDDARSQIVWHEIEQEKQRKAADIQARTEAARYNSLDELEKGQEVFMHTLRYWATVERVNKKTVTISNPFGSMKVSPEQLYREDPRTFE